MVKIGDRIECISMDDPQAVPAGTCGTVYHIDDVGTIHVRWDNGSGLGLIPGEDEYKIIGGR